MFALAAMFPLLAPGSADASENVGQLIFTAMDAPLASITQNPGNPISTYLFWAKMEGQLPADLAAFRIYRDEVQLGSDIPLQVMSPAEIATLYAGEGQSRRRAALVSNLSKLDSSTNETNFHLRLHALIDPQSPDHDPVWSVIGARTDFNIAIATRRGYRDDDAPTGLHEYELVGVATDQTEQRFGHIEFKVSEVSPDVLPAAANIVQIALPRCDLPETHRYHSTVALDWELPGAGVDLFRHEILITGFDVYRATENLASGQIPAPLDIRALASVVGHAADGSFELAGLEKVNDSPIIISGGQGLEERYAPEDGTNAAWIELLETPEQLRAAGLERGDRREYYFVTIDYTRNYGETEMIVVTIPDLARPPVPSDVEFHYESRTDTATLMWDHQTVASYFERSRIGRTYCNLDTARFDGELEWVGRGQSCDSSAHFEMPFDVVRYHIYRFAQPREAERCTADSDGDGRCNRDERPLSGVGPDGRVLTDSTQVCDPLSWPGGIANHLVASIDATAPALVARPGARLAMEFVDTELGNPANRGVVYHYRLVAERENGVRSEMSAPIRAFFPDRARPGDPNCRLGEPSCPLAAQLVNPPLPPGIPFAADQTQSQEAAYVQVSCIPVSAPPYSQIHDVTELPWAGGTSGVDLDALQCDQLRTACLGTPVQVEYLDAIGQLLGSTGIGVVQTGCFVATELVDDCQMGSTVPSQQAGSAHGPLRLECSPETGVCLNVYREVGDANYKLGTFCELPICFDGYMIDAATGAIAECEGEPNVVSLPNLGGEALCLSVVPTNENNVHGSPIKLPCVHTATRKPEPPNLRPTASGKSFSGKLLAIDFLPPQQPLLGTLLRWRETGTAADEEEGHGVLFVPHPELQGQDGPIPADLALGLPEPGSDEAQEWCVQGRSVARLRGGDFENTLSDWSVPLCLQRLPPEAEDGPNMDWPAFAVPSKQGDLESRYFNGDKLLAVALTDAIDFSGSPSCSLPLTTCQPENLNATCFPTGVDGPPDTGIQCDNLCEILEDALQSVTPFVMYRQEREISVQAATSFYQISPLVPGMFCEGNTIDDPLLKLLSFPVGDPWEGIRVVFLDRAGHLGPRDYRWETVGFDERGEITSYRNTEDAGGASTWTEARP